MLTVHNDIPNAKRGKKPIFLVKLLNDFQTVNTDMHIK